MTKPSGGWVALNMAPHHATSLQACGFGAFCHSFDVPPYRMYRLNIMRVHTFMQAVERPG